MIVVACVFNSWLTTSFNGLGPVFFISSFRNASLPVSSSHSGPRNAIVSLSLCLLCFSSFFCASLFCLRGPVASPSPRLIERIKESSRKFSSNHAECRLKTAQRERWLRSSFEEEEQKKWPFTPGFSKLIRLMTLPLLMKMGVLCFSDVSYSVLLLFFYLVSKRCLRVSFLFVWTIDKNEFGSKIARWSHAKFLDICNKKGTVF